MVNLTSFASISLTKKMYGWTKYGGARKGIVKETLDTWYCQICAEEQTLGLPAYMIHIGDRDFIRICSKCFNKLGEGFTLSQIKISISRGLWVDNHNEDWLN